MRTPMSAEQIEAYRRRIEHPDGKCFRCEQPADHLAPVGPINVAISDPEFVGPEGIRHQFCCWECLAHWAAQQAGGNFVAGQDTN